MPMQATHRYALRGGPLGTSQQAQANSGVVPPDRSFLLSGQFHPIEPQGLTIATEGVLLTSERLWGA